MNWRGVYPAVTTQFSDDLKVDLKATGRVIDNLIKEGSDGLVMCGTVGEGCSLSGREKRNILSLAVEAADRKIPVVAGIAEYTPNLAATLAKDAAKIGVDGLMVLPSMVYTAAANEIRYHYETVAKATYLPIMLYNNPPSYKIDLTPEIIADLAKIETVTAIKESSGQPNRLVDIRNTCGDDLTLVCGLDDVVMESVQLAAVGWVSGMSNVFPKEAKALLNLTLEGQTEKALEIYRWFMPLLHLDARPDLVQCIKLCEELAGRGSALPRPPRLPLEENLRAEVTEIFKTAEKNRPTI